MVRQTDASQAVQLFGDRDAPGYVDESPRDGIDDNRARLLLSMAARFSPYLVRNTTSGPMDWKKFIGRARSFPLYVDRWDVGTSPEQLVKREQIEFAELPKKPCPDSNPEAAPLLADCALVRLLRDFDPDHPRDERARTLADRASGAMFTVMYFDFPGDNGADWKAEYTAPFSDRLRRSYEGYRKIYAHPFVAPAAGGGLEFVIQYWFFYPFNEGANQHLGDWEHINVLISPRSRVGAPLTQTDVLAMLARAPHELGGADPLVVARVDYYMHSKVYIMDYAHPNVYGPRTVWEREVAAFPEEQRGQQALLRLTRERAYADKFERYLNTHPIGWIGGDSKSLELLLAPPGERNKASHATFPFRGTFKDIGPAAATEEVGTKFDLHDYTGPDAKPWPDNVEKFDEPDLLELVPDWERIHDLTQTDPEVRREWSWLMLPLRWGYPAVPSPFAGIISHAETGNIPPNGPPYNEGSWNRTGTAGSSARYEPHHFSGLFPLSPLDAMVNSFGFLNAPFVALTIVPPFDLLYRLIWRPVVNVVPPGLPDVFVPEAPEQKRVIGVALGLFVNEIPSSFGSIFLNSAQIDAINQRLASINIPDNAKISVSAASPIFPSLQVQIYLLPRLVSQNTFRYWRGDLTLQIDDASGASLANMRGSLQMFEWAGSLRFNVLTGRIQPFVKAGFGYSWYRIQNVTVDGQLISPKDSPYLHTSFWPNTLHYGLGLEATLIEGRAPLTTLGVGLKAEANIFSHGLGLDTKDTSGLGLSVDTFISRPNFDFAVVFSY
jgi:hypothetical protein